MADFKLSANIEVRKQAPLDDRLAKMTKADLIKPESWASDNGTYYVYQYMVVGTEDGLFMLLDVNKLLDADFSGWKKIGNESTPTGGLTEDEVRDLLGVILADYVQKEEGKGLSSNDYTNEDKTKLDGLNNYDDTTIKEQIQGLQNSLNTLVGGNATDAIESFNEIVAFLASIKDTQTLGGIINGINQAIAAVEAKIQAVPTKTSELTNDSGYITLDDVPEPDLSDYAKKTDIPTDYIKEIPGEYVTESELEERLSNFVPEGGGSTGGVSEDRVNQLIAVETQRAQNAETALQAAINAEVKRANGVEELLTQRITEETTNRNAANTSIDNKFTKMIGDEATRATQAEEALQGSIDSENERAEYAEKVLSDAIEEVDGKIPTRTSQLENNSNFLTEHQSLEHLATKDELATKQNKIEDLDAIREGSQRAIPTKVSELENDKGYLTEHQDISHLVTNEDIAGMAEDTAQAKANSEAALTQSNQAKVNADAALTTSNVAIESIKSLQGLSNADAAMVELAKQITQIAQNTSDIQMLQQKHQTLTEEEFEALEAAGELKEGVFYYIYEE